MRLLLVFLNEPIPGKVNQQLASDVGQDEAVRYYQAMVEVLLRQLQGLEHCRIRFCHAPDDAGEAIRFWLLAEMQATSGPKDNLYLAPGSHTEDELTQEVDFHPQGSGKPGERLHRAFSRAFADGYQQVAAIGSQCPECGARWINAAFSRLNAESGRDAVIGPSKNGGYYLLALKSPAPALFENIPCSDVGLFSSTLSAAQDAGLSVESLPSLAEVTDLANWQHLLASPLGAALKKAMGEPIEDEYSTEL